MEERSVEFKLLLKEREMETAKFLQQVCVWMSGPYSAQIPSRGVIYF